ncbi:MAG TPA: 4-(cytidine 5'-diphospho)-2-C-methyl-D-erythritol kinase [Rhizomicrobium sp.]|nr:4-(cytidine 5'-diphospho)-2-C-methyl-D-erythritol kinase [Rhizomicrobium sp.]
MISEAAPAKINLFLHVGTRRADGFHPLQSLAVFTGLGDVLEMEAAADLSLSIQGPFAKALEGEGDNLVLRAARSLLQDAAVGSARALLTLTKNLPVASGIGGGSADAAAALRGLSRLWGASGNGLHEIAAKLGSDIPVCLDSLAAFMEGRGEVLRAVQSMPLLPMLLVNPGVPVPTKDVFATLETRSGVEMTLPGGRFQDTADLLRFLDATRNDLEQPAIKLRPVIGEVLAAIAALPGALLARMSGSGATCFGIFADDDCCRRAARIVEQAQPDWWVAPTFVPEYGIAHETTGQDIGPSDTGL